MSSGQQSQQFCVRWNSHLGSIGAAFPQLLAGQRFVDVTLACEGHQVHCHRLVLAACSTFFENLLGENPCKHPIIILPREIKLWAIQALVDFMYKGEVNVSQAGLPDLMKCAEILKIRGLCGSDAALNLNQITSPGGGSSSSGSSSAGNSSAQQRESSNQSGQRGTSPQRMEQDKGQQNSALSGTTTKTGGVFLETLKTNPVASSTPTKVPSQQQLQQQPNLHQSGDDGDNSDNGGSGSEMCIKTEDLIIDEDVGKGGEEEEEMETEGNDKMQAEFAEQCLANVTCEYDSGSNAGTSSDQTPNANGRRVRRSETLLSQAADFVSRGKTFQTVSDMFNIPISTIRFYMARKGILPRRKRGRTAILPYVVTGTSQIPLAVPSSSSAAIPNSNQLHATTFNVQQRSRSRSSSPAELLCFANYKLPELRPKLV